MNILTHEKIEQKLCGRPLAVENGKSRVALETTDAMQVDEFGLVHGGFIFGLADHAAMVAVNHPNVVLGGAEVKFLKPITTGERVVAEATVASVSGKKHIVNVTVRRNEDTVFTGTFTCFVLDRHVLC